MNDESESVLVKLTRMEGKLDMSNLRHDQHDARFSSIDNRLNRHGERITGLEHNDAGRDGERKGLSTAGRIAWATVGLIPGGAIVAALMKLFGV